MISLQELRLRLRLARMVLNGQGVGYRLKINRRDVGTTGKKKWLIAECEFNPSGYDLMDSSRDDFVWREALKAGPDAPNPFKDHKYQDPNPLPGSILSGTNRVIRPDGRIEDYD